MEKLVIGIIGCGSIGQMHVENIIKNFKYVEIKSIADIDIITIKKWAKKIGIKNTYSDFNEVLVDPEIKAVLISTPTGTHEYLIMEAAKKDKNIFCEKPIGLNPKKIKEAIDIVRNKDIKLQVGFMRRFDKNYIKVNKMVKNGELGNIHMVRIASRDITLPSVEYIKNTGGLFQENTSHEFDIIRYLTQSEIEEVYAMTASHSRKVYVDYKYYDTAIVVLKFKNDIIGIIDNSANSTYGYDQRVEVFGSKGCIMVDNVLPTQVKIMNEDGIISDKLYNTELYYIDRYSEAYVVELEHFFNSILKNKPVAVDGMDGLISVLIGIAAQKSVEKNKPIKIDYNICN